MQHIHHHGALFNTSYCSGFHTGPGLFPFTTEGKTKAAQKNSLLYGPKSRAAVPFSFCNRYDVRRYKLVLLLLHVAEAEQVLGADPDQSDSLTCLDTELDFWGPVWLDQKMSLLWSSGISLVFNTCFTFKHSAEFSSFNKIFIPHFHLRDVKLSSIWWKSTQSTTVLRF